MKILITEVQLKYLVEQQVQSIDFVDECGKVKTFKSNSTEYSKFYHTNIKFYKWDGKKYNYVKTNIWPKWDNLTKAQQDQLLKARCSGSYKDQPNLITAAVKEIGSFTNWIPSTIQDWVDWLTWFISWLGPQGKALATAAKGIQGMAYIYFGLTSQSLSDIIKKIIEGFAQLLDIVGWKIKVPGYTNRIDNITKFLEKSNFNGIYAKLKAKGHNLNEKFNSIPKWAQAVLTLIVEVTGEGIATVFNWITNNILTPLYNFIAKYNTTVANGLKTMIDYLVLFSSLVETTNIIINDPDTKNILKLTPS